MLEIVSVNTRIAMRARIELKQLKTRPQLPLGTDRFKDADVLMKWV